MSKMRVADYIAEAFVKNGIDHMFSVTGGGAMHLNDAFGKKPGLQVTYNHHEQACAIAAEGYARIAHKPGAICVTTGPGGTNALTGVLGAWLDSIPMIIISGQVRYDTTARASGLPIRAFGDQEFDITKSIKNMTKYAEMVIDPTSIRYHLERALYLCSSGRPGPVWLDIPVNVQSNLIDPDDLTGYNSVEDSSERPPELAVSTLKKVMEQLRVAKRPVLYLGSAIVQNNLMEQIDELSSILKIPVVTAWNAIEAIESDNPYYIGRPGNLGDRAGNFTVQNSDLVLSLGCRLSIRQVGFNWETWAREAYRIVVDIDPYELKKKSINADFPIQADVKEFVPQLINMAKSESIGDKKEWLDWCLIRKHKYPVVLPEYWKRENYVNPYCLAHSLTDFLPEHSVVFAGNGTCCVVASHCAIIKKGTRVVYNSGNASMGYDLPASIGGCFAHQKKSVVCLAGDGSLQMNIQELQTVVHHGLPIKLFVFNNHGYHSIRQTQTNYFGEPLVGVDEKSGISFPDMEKISIAYGITYRKIENHADMAIVIPEVLALTCPAIIEVTIDIQQTFQPRSVAKKLADGSMFSPPLEELYPFLSEDEFQDNMLINLVVPNK